MDKVNFKASIPGEFYKQDTPGEAPAGKADSAPVTEAEVEESIGDLFGLNESSSEGADAPHPFSMTIAATPDPGYSYDPVTGEKKKDPNANPYYVPTLDEIDMKMKDSGLPLSFDILDEVEANYQKAFDDLTAKKKKLNDQLPLVQNDPLQYEYTNKLLALVSESLSIVKEALDKLPAWRDDLEAGYKKEYEEFKAIAKEYADAYNKGDENERSEIIKNYLSKADQNLDKHVGDPSNGKGLRIGETKSGLAVLYDLTTETYITKISSNGVPCTSKWFDPSATWGVASDGVKVSETKIGSESLTLEIDGASQAEGNNTFNAKVDINIPDYIVVKTDKDGEPKLKYDDKTDETYYSAAPVSTENGVITQKVPDDLDGYTQVFIAQVKVHSDMENKDREGFDQLVDLIDKDGNIVYQIRVTGRNGTGPASDFSLALDGKDRQRAIFIDASDMLSTGKHEIWDGSLDKIKQDYNVDFNKCDDPSMAETAFDNALEPWNSGSEAGLNNIKSTEVTGLMVDDVYGYVVGSSSANNFVCFKDPKEAGESFQPREGKDEEENPFYKNVFVGGEKHNAVFSRGKGDLLASGVTLGWRDCTGSGISAMSSISINNTIVDENDDVVNLDVFAAMVGGGDKLLDNPTDTDSTDADGDVKKKTGDDYLFTGGTGSYSSPKVNEEGGVGDPDADSNKFDEGALDKVALEEEGQKIVDALCDMDLMEKDPLEDMGAEGLGGDFYDKMKSEQDSFFSAMTETFDFTNQGMDDGEDGSTEEFGEELVEEAVEEGPIE